MTGEMVRILGTGRLPRWLPLLLAAAALLLSSGAGHAYEERVKPVYYWNVMYVGPPYNAWQNSPGEAFAQLRDYVSPPIKLNGPFPSGPPYDITVNGNALYYSVDRQASPNDGGNGEYMWIQGMVICPEGYALSLVPGSPFGNSYSAHCSRQTPDDPSPHSCPVSNPIYPSAGIKVQAETDYLGPDGLAFVRTYRSNKGYFASVATSGWVDNTVPGAAGHASVPGKVKNGPSSFAQGTFQVVGSGSQDYYLMDADGRRVEFAGPPDAIAPKSPETRIAAARQTDAQGAVEWRLTREDGGVDVYNAQGALVSSSTPSGLATAYAYSDASTPAAVAPRPGLLVAITGPSGRSLGFTYNAAGQMATLTDPAGGITRYGYDADSNLTSVAYPDGTSKAYLYNEPAYTGGASQPHALTGIVDENGARYATYQYSATGKAIATEHAGGAGRHRFAYHPDVFNAPVASATVTDPLGTPRTYGFATVAGAQRETGVSQPGGSGCAAASDAITYDAHGNITSRTDFNGNLSCHAYDPARNLETVRVEGIAPSGTCPADLAAYAPKPNSAERKTATAWHPAYRLPAQIDEAGRRTLFSYDANGNLTGKTIQDTATGQSRAWAWTYDAKGRVLTEDGPRTDANDVTAYTYDDTNGNLLAVRNAAGHTTQYGDYDAHGRPRRIADLNGHVTTLAYDARGRLASKAEDGHATAYAYDGAGQLTRLGLPNGAFYTYAYDDAHRLTDIADALGNRLHYTLDAAGHRVREDTYAADGTLAKTRRRVFDALDRLAQDVGAYNQTTRYEYDANGNLTRRTDPEGHATAYAYDALDRLATQTDALGGATRYRYDALGRLATVTDPAGLATAYQYDGLGNLTRLDSPDTGATLYGHDDAGNLTRRLDANGVQALYAYDALNRVRKADYPGTADDTAYTYDYWSPANAGIGRLYKAANGAVVVKFAYDLSGRVTAQSLALPGSYAPLAQLAYRYDAAGLLVGVTYPSGAQIDYPRDAAGQVAAATLTQSGQTAMLADNLRHGPFGPPQSLAYGNGLAWSQAYDLDGRPQRQTLAGLQDLAHAYGPAGNLQSLADALDPARSQSFGYDALDRLDTATGPYGALGYAYDADGGRLAETRGGQATNYAYAPGSQRLQSAGGQTYAYDANGNTVQAGSLTFAYGPGNRLKQILQGGATLGQYAYDGLGRRVSKTAGGGTRYFLYGQGGELLAELDAAGSPQAEHLWLDGSPLAVLQGGQTAYVHADHLGAPRLITDAAGTPVWRWGGGPFGAEPADEDPDGDGVPFAYNLRFPGQYFDAEGGLHYNMARYYDPATGRYRESDPIGLAGGLNSYAYVENNPLNFVDPFGLESRTYSVPTPPLVFPLGSPGYNATLDGLNAFSDAMHDAVNSIMNMIGDVPVSDAAKRDAEHRAYKDYCQNPPPPTGDKCTDLQNRINYHLQRANMMEQWDVNWPHQKYLGGRHAGEIASRRAAAAKLQAQFDFECRKNCP